MAPVQLRATAMTPEITYTILLIVQALHLLHHRLAKRHISFVEVLAGVVLCIPSNVPVPGVVLMAVHLSLIAVQAVGSIWIDKLSPTHDGRGPLAKIG